MSRATQALLEELSVIVDKDRYLLLTGGSAVGKTLLAFGVANNCAQKRFDCQGQLSVGMEKYDVETAFISIHPSFAYEDFVSGISISTIDGKVDFQYADKVFLKMLKKANSSWYRKDNRKYFLIIDDIGRGAISGILGDLLPLIEPHGDRGYSYRIKSRDGQSIWITPNVYIIATANTAIDAVEQGNYAFLRHFYERTIESDFRFMSDDTTTAYSDYDISSNALFYRSKRIVSEHLKHRYQMTPGEINRYVIGHGVFKNKGTSLYTKYQVIPMLKQYVKEGILDKTALPSIASISKLVDGELTKDPILADMGHIVLHKTGVTPLSFVNEGLTHQPLVNLVSRIKEQGLLSDSDIISGILFNPQVLVRKKAALDKVERTFPTPGYLYIEKSKRDLYTYGTTVNSKGAAKRPRFFYSRSVDDGLTVDGVDYAIASEMQPGEYTRWYEDLNTGQEENERYSSSPNSIMFRILRSYYTALEQHYAEYLALYPGDDNVAKLRAFAAQEYLYLVEESRKLHPEISDEKPVNAKANDDFRNLIGTLVLFWKNKGETISIGGQAFTVEGVYKVDNTERFEQFSKAMDTLDIHQVIMQGPPGTSKTYSAREYLRFVGSDISNGVILSDSDLDQYQICDYSGSNPISAWGLQNPGVAPRIAWDIVQFHPSYGYEDFVRGIEVSTVQAQDGHSSYVSYETVNKVLGKIANLASLPEFKDTRFYLVIDEINRANLATVFGELIYGLEYRGKSVATPYMVNNSNKVILPSNLYIVGTMNTADKSIGGIDYAIRRRFLFFSLLPDPNVILNYHITGVDVNDRPQKEINQKAVLLFDWVAGLFDSDNLNSEYYRDDVQIGHTYFLVDSEDQLFMRFRYQVLPILREYYKDGIFQIDRTDSESDGWTGLLGCVTGEIDINVEADRVRDIFDKLTSSTR